MKAARLLSPSQAEQSPLTFVHVDAPRLPDGHLLVRVHACGVCRTDLHIVEGDLALPKLPLTPGHQVVGVVQEAGSGVRRFKAGHRIGIPWLYSTCGACEFCRSGRENLCDSGRFTGYHVDGGYAELVVVHEDFAHAIPGNFSDAEAAPLLCAGVIGYRSLRLSEIKPGQRVALVGFGASAHIALQIVRHWGCEAYVMTRSAQHKDLAVELGASWAGSADEQPPHQVEAAVVFAPAGPLVHAALRHLRKGGTVSLAGIHMTPIPQMEYKLIYEERTLRSAANSTRDDVQELLELAGRIPIRTEVETFGLGEANAALLKLKRSELRGSGVLVVRQ